MTAPVLVLEGLQEPPGCGAAGRGEQHRQGGLARTGGVCGVKGVRLESAPTSLSWFCDSCSEGEGRRKVSPGWSLGFVR